MSLAAGHYHQGRLGKRMWRRLERARLIPPPPPGRFHDEWLLDLRFGLTDIVKRPSPRGDALSRADFRHGRERLHSLLRAVRPPLICFIYKRAAREAIGARLPSGAGLIAQSLGAARVFLLPGPYTDERTAQRILAGLRSLLHDPSGARRPRESSR